MSTRTRRSGALAAGALAFLSVSACAPANPDVQTPGATSTAPTTQADAAPRIENPKDLSSVSNACTLLTKEQVAKLGGGGKPESSTSIYQEPECDWSNDNFAMDLAINTNYGGVKALTADIRAKEDITPTKVAGYPASRVSKQSNLCVVRVAVSQGQSFEVSYALYSGDAPAMQKPCEYAEKIAAEVLENIPDA